MYFKNEQMELTVFLHTGTNSRKLKNDGKFLGWAWSKMSVASLVKGFKNSLHSKNEEVE